MKIFCDRTVCEIIRTLKPDDPDQAEIIMRGDWDYVLIFADENSREVFDEILSTIRQMNFPTDKIISVDKIVDWARNSEAVYILNPSNKTCETIYRRVNIDNHRRWNYYVTCTTEDINYVGTSADRTLIPDVYIAGKTFADDEMKAFHALTKKFYGVDDADGYFLDLGANIGTTGIYFLKKLAPNLKLFAVEPDAENFKLLRVNLIMNDLENRVTLVNCGLGEDFDTLTMYRDLSNPGVNSVIPYFVDRPTETIQIAPLDYLLAESKIAPDEVRYIWIDTEGFEPQVLFGAKNLLAKSFVPVFMECNLLTWKNSGSLDRLVDFLANVGYRHFISIDEFLRTGNEKVYPIENLLVAVNYAKPPIGRVGDIFLIKNLQA